MKQKKIVHTFKFNRNDLIKELRINGVHNWESKAFQEALKKPSLTQAVDHVMIYSPL